MTALENHPKINAAIKFIGLKLFSNKQEKTKKQKTNSGEPFANNI